MAEQVPQAVAGRAIAQVVQNPQPAQGEPAVAQQAQDQPMAQQAQNQEVCIFFCLDTMWLIIFQWLIFIGRV